MTMSLLVDFNMINEINHILKEKGIEYSIHALGGCNCSGLQLRQDGKSWDINQIIDIINEYIGSKWIKVASDKDDPTVLHVYSKFDYER